MTDQKNQNEPMHPRWRRRWVAAVVLAMLASVGLPAVLSVSSSRPVGLGVTGGKLAPCPGSPNCVSTQAQRTSQLMQPISCGGSAADARTTLLKVLSGMDRCRVVTSEEDYVHAEFRTPFFGFVDDVEFFIDRDATLIHFRSASRVGHSDLGVNRKRMQEIRSRFERSLRSAE